MNLLSTLLIGLTASAAAWSSDIELGIPSHAGNGCPSNSVAAVLSPDNKELSLMFDQYTAEAGGTTGKRLDRKSCLIGIPVKVPQGYSFSIVSIDYRGFNSIPSGGRSMFTAEYFFPGQRGVRSTRTFSGPQDQEFTITNQLGVSALVWSACGAETNLRANTSMTAISNYYNDEVLATIDSMDIKAGLIFHLAWKRCN